MTKTKSATLLNIPLAKVSPSGSNPRLTLDKGAFKELQASILQNGLLQPIAVRAVDDNYEIVGGHRRYLAVRELEREHPDDPRFTTIAALVVDLADGRIGAARLAENINRADLNPLEIAEGIASALESGMTEKELAHSLGWKERRVYSYQQLHEAPAHSDHREHFDRSIVNAQTDARDRSEATLALFSSWWAFPSAATRP